MRRRANWNTAWLSAQGPSGLLCRDTGAPSFGRTSTRDPDDPWHTPDRPRVRRSARPFMAATPRCSRACSSRGASSSASGWWSMASSRTAPDAADAWLITGSPHGVYEDRPWIAPLERLIHEIPTPTGRLWDSLLRPPDVAQAFGGRRRRNHEGGWALGRRDYPESQGPERLRSNAPAPHQDQVSSRPRGRASSGGNAFRNYFCRTGPTYWRHILTACKPTSPNPMARFHGAYLLRLRGTHLSPRGARGPP